MQKARIAPEISDETPGIVGFSEDSEVAEQTPLEKRKVSRLVLIQFVRSLRKTQESSLDRHSTEFNLFGIFLDPVVAVMDYRRLSFERPQTHS